MENQNIQEVEEKETVVNETSVEETSQVEEHAEDSKTEMSETEKKAQQDKTISIILKILVYILLTIGAFTCLFPFYWMIMSSFKSLREYVQEVPHRGRRRSQVRERLLASNI